MKFLDTNFLLKNYSKMNEKFVISSTTLSELENIKVSNKKDEQVRYEARKAVHFLVDNNEMYNVVVVNDDILKLLERFKIENSPDNQICACAFYYAAVHDEDVVFCSMDLCCATIAKKVFGLNVDYGKEIKEDIYKGYKEVVLSNDDMAYFYEHLTDNVYELLVNEYLIIKDKGENIVDKLKWDGNEYVNVKYPTIKSNYFGVVKPYNGDIYQQMVLNSLSNNQVTMIKGSAGTGKSYLAVGYMMWLLEKKKIDKIVVFCNTVATANSAKLGFYPGTKDEKLLDSAIGNMLSAKLGDSFGLEQMMAKNIIELLPMSDIRGFDTTGMNCAVYITEAQNLDISLMKLALQRIGEDCICIIDGDYTTQVDMSQYAGSNNGMRRMSEVFRGQDFYGEIELQNIYRSKIAMIAENM